MNELDPKSNHTHKSDETLHGAPSMLSSRFLNRKKYNVISEEVRKRIIKKLTIENANIKDVIIIIYTFMFIIYYQHTKKIKLEFINNNSSYLHAALKFIIIIFFIKVAKEFNLKLSTCKAIL